MKNVVLLFVLFLTNTINSQIIDNSNGKVLTESSFFNSEFISKNKIKAIKGKYTFKKVGDIMRQTDYERIYTFDTLGNLSSFFDTNSKNGLIDTTHTTFEYNSSNLLQFVSKKINNGYIQIQYYYDSLNRVTSITTRKEIIDPINYYSQSLILNEETMTYENYPNQEKKTIFNSYNRPYLEVFSYLDSTGKVTSIEKKLKMTSGVIKFNYTYDEQGQITAIKTVNNIDKETSDELIFKYDVNGNITEKHIHRNGEFLTNIQIMYNKETAFMTSLLKVEVKNNYMTIIRFKDYEFYP